MFETSRPTCLATNWSKTGLGYTLTQKHCDCPGPTSPHCKPGHWKLVFAGSRFTRGPETRYAPIEGEALAVAYGLRCCRMFIMGCPELIVATDHKPLIKILNDRELETIANPRLLQLKEKTLMYRFRIIHIAGSSNGAPDATSRYPTSDCDYSVQDIDEGTSLAFAVHQANDIRSVTWTNVNDAAMMDEECTVLAQTIYNGFPESRDELPENIRQFWPMRDDLYMIENVPFRGKKMLIPKVLRRRVLEGLHAANQGVSGMLANARERLFWPGLDAAVRLTRSQCRQCNEHAPSQPSEPEIVAPQPEIPFQQTVMDLCELGGHHFLVYADRYTGWAEVIKPSSTSFRNLEPILLKWFTTFGVPEELSADGGPPFNSSDYRDFLHKWGIQKRQSSAHYPQSNGRAEAAVKSVKRILMGNINPTTGGLDTDRAARALLTHRNTPVQDTGIAPSVALFGHRLRDHLPDYHRKIRIEWQQIADAREIALGKRHLRTSGREQGVQRELIPLERSDTVQIQNQQGTRPNRWHNTGVIAEVLPHRQYRVIVDGSRRVTLRNRRFLRKIDPVCRKRSSIDSYSVPLETPVVETQSQLQKHPMDTVRLEPETGGCEPELPQPHPTSPTPIPIELTVVAKSPTLPPTTSLPPLETEVTQVRRSARTRRMPDRLDL